MNTEDKIKESENQEYNFKPDSTFKYLFTRLSNPTKIRLINSIFNIKLDNLTKIDVLNTESVIYNTVDSKLENMRADLLLKAGYKRLLHIEFQSTNDDLMGLRVFLYGLESAKAERKDKILKFPLSHVIYTVLNKEKYGKDYIILDIDDCTIDNKNYKDCKIQVNINYTNLLSFSLDDFVDNNLEALSFIYLYKYLKDKKKCEKEENIKTILSEIDIISNILKNISILDIDKICVPMANIIQDIISVVSSRTENKEMIKMLKEKERIYSDIIKNEALKQGFEQGIEQGIGQGKILGIIEMAKELNWSDKEIKATLKKKFNLSEEDIIEYMNYSNK